MRNKKKILLNSLIIFVVATTTSCGSELAEARAATYCECLHEAKGEMTKMDECLKIIDSAKIEFEGTPRHWIKFQEALGECQN